MILSAGGRLWVTGANKGPSQLAIPPWPPVLPLRTQDTATLQPFHNCLDLGDSCCIPAVSDCVCVCVYVTALALCLYPPPPTH